MDTDIVTGTTTDEGYILSFEIRIGVLQQVGDLCFIVSIVEIKLT